MRISNLTINNCKSYRDQTAIPLDRHFNVLVGPNGGGKSNTLDIINVILRHNFLWSYQRRPVGQPPNRQYDVQRQTPFSPIEHYLESHIGQEDRATEIEITLEVGPSDVRNLTRIFEHRDRLRDELAGYRNTPHGDSELGALQEDDRDLINQGQEHDFLIRNGNLNQGATTDEGQAYLRYLRSLNYCLLLTRRLSEPSLDPVFIHFPPYRGASPQDLYANVSNENFNNQLVNYFGTTSHEGPSSLLKIASLFFAGKRRRLEATATEEGYQERWEADDHVRRVAEYLERLNYTWDLDSRDIYQGIYEIVMTRHDRRFRVTQASSGEKEILNFIFGIFSLGTTGGLVVVDEPELHLHPRWQNILRDIYIDVAQDTDNQIVISTHSPTFLSPDTVANVRRVYTDNEGGTQVSAVQDDQVQDRRSLLHIVNSQNNEQMFFADRVVLVEGISDRLVFTALIEQFRNAANLTDIVEVLDVGGKHNFERYSRFLEGMEVDYRIIGDLDYITDVREDCERFFESDHDRIDRDVLLNRNSWDRDSIIECLEVAVATGDTERLQEILDYVRGRFRKLREELDDDEQEELQEVLTDLRADGIFVLSAGEIEDYLPQEVTDVDDVIELVEQEELLEWLRRNEDDAQVHELEEIAVESAGLPVNQLDELRDRVRG